MLISLTGQQALSKWYSTRLLMSSIAKKIIKKVWVDIEKTASYYDQEEYDDIKIGLAKLRGLLMGYEKVYKEEREQWNCLKEDTEVKFLIYYNTYIFKGFIDMLPIIKDKPVLFETKIVSNINVAFIERLPMDGQVRGYILGARKALKIKPKQVIYNAIKKCKLRKKSGESVDEFCERIADDYKERPEFYFHREKLRFASEDVLAYEHAVAQTHRMYIRLIAEAKDPLNPLAWPECDHSCAEFNRTCEFLPLCTQGLDIATSKMYEQWNPEDKGKGKRGND